MLCPHCGQEHPENTKFCIITGKIIEEPMSRCPHCGRILPQGLIFCTSCGKRLIENLTIENPLISNPTLSEETQITEDTQSIETDTSFSSDPNSNIIEQESTKRIRCPSCSLEIPANSKFCIYCGALIDDHLAADTSFSYDTTETENITCPQCSAELPAGTKFCIYCGFAINQEQRVVSESLESQHEPHHCPNCNTPYPYDEESGKPLAKYCTICGTLLLKEDLPAANLSTIEDNASIVEQNKSEMIACPHCGNELPVATKFCIYCGNAVSVVVKQSAFQAELDLSHLEHPIVLSSNEKEADTESPSESGKAKICNYCKLVYEDQDGICPSCGTSSEGNLSYQPKQVTAMQNCTYCGLILPQSMPFCPSCNTQLHPEAETLKMGIPLATNKCTTCGLFFSDNEEKCPSCGTPISIIPISKDGTEPTAAADIQACPACHADVPLGMAFCPNCGAALPSTPEPTTATQVCPACHADVPLGMAFCPNCGAALPSTPEPAADTLACPACHADVPLGMAFCPNCGAALPSTPEPTADTQACPACSADVPLGMAFCPNCGAALPSTSEPTADTQACPACHADVPLGMAFCPNCGAALPSTSEPKADTQACPACHADVPLGMAFCPNCGAALPSTPEPKADTQACPACHADVPLGMAFCPNCGAALPSTPEPKADTQPCPACHADVPIGMAFCPNCSAALPLTPEPAADTQACPACHADVPLGMAFCPNCGAALLSTSEPKADTQTCPACHADVPLGMAFCPNCGAALPSISEPTADTQPCPACHADVPLGMAFCPNCGAALPSTPEPTGADTQACPACHADVPLGMAFCPNCGAALPSTPEPTADTQSCPACHADVPLGMAFCPNCGAALPSTSEPAAEDKDTIHCPNCAEVIPADLFFCPICGTALQKKESLNETSPKQSSIGIPPTPEEETEKKIVDTSSNKGLLEANEEVGYELDESPIDAIVEEDTVLCTNCGMRVLKTLKYCNHCGASIILFHENEEFVEESLPSPESSPETSVKQVDNEIKPLPPDTKTCPNCLAILPLGEKVCSVCGASLFQDQTSILCPQCGQELPLEAKFCVHCGVSFYSESTPTDIKIESEEEASKTSPTDLSSEKAKLFLDEESSPLQKQNKGEEATPQPSANFSSTQKSEACGFCGLRFTVPVNSCPSCGMPLRPLNDGKAEEDSSIHQWNCTYCGFINKTEQECASCGTPQNGGAPTPAPPSPSPTICLYCSYVNKPNTLTCASCGAPIKREASPSSAAKDSPIPSAAASSSSQADYASSSPVLQSKKINDTSSPISTKTEASSVSSPTPIEENILPESAEAVTSDAADHEDDKKETSTSSLKTIAARKPWILIGGGIVLLFLLGIIGVAAWQGLNPKKTYSIEAELTQLATAYKPIATLAPKQLTPNLTITETQTSALAASPFIPTAAIGICNPETNSSEQSCEPSPMPTVLETEAATEKPTSLPISETPSTPATQTSSSTTETSSSAEPTKTNPRDQAILVKIPAGEFLMGSEVGTDSNYVGNEGPVHTVYLNEYWIYQTEVTNKMYAQCVEEKACTLPKAADQPTSHFNKSGFENHPVVQINWDQAKMYCEWAGGRLPTEAEWEKAARGTDGRRFPWGNDPLDGTRLNYCDKQCSLKEKDEKQDDGYATTAPVGSYPKGASPYGVFDMSGNVWEWVADWFSPTYYRESPRENPQGPPDGELRVMRGGSWSNKLPVQFRTANRQSMLTNSTFDTLGFRCVIVNP